MDRMRNPLAQHVNYSFLDGVIQSYSGFILPSNIDGILERKGSFLVLEWKRKEERLSRGQDILLRNLAALSPFKVIVVTGHAASREDVEVHEFHTMMRTGLSASPTGVGVEQLRLFIQKWWAWASRDR